MTVEIFYPKELRDVIKDLRAKDDLNEYAKSEMDRQFIILFIFAFIFLCIAFFYFNDIYSGILFSVLLLAHCLFYFRLKYKKPLGVYIFGIRKKCIIKKIAGGGTMKSRIICVSIENDEVFKSADLMELRKPKAFLIKEGLEKGKKINIFYDPQKRFRAMPDLDFINHKYCLSKGVLKGEANDMAKNLQIKLVK